MERPRFRISLALIGTVCSLVSAQFGDQMPFQNNYNPQQFQQAPMGQPGGMNGFGGDPGFSANYRLPDGSNVQRANYVAPEAPNSYRPDAYPQTRQFFSASPGQQDFSQMQPLGGQMQQGMPMGGQMQQGMPMDAGMQGMPMDGHMQGMPMGAQGQGMPGQFGMSEPGNRFPEVNAPNMQFNAPQIPTFREPEFDFSGLERLQAGMANMAGGWPSGGSSRAQPNGPVGPGQMAVPGLPANNPLQQLAFGSQLDDRLSAAPIDSGNGLNENQPSLFLNLQQGQADLSDSPRPQFNRQNARHPPTSQETVAQPTRPTTAQPEPDAPYESSSQSVEETSVEAVPQPPTEAPSDVGQVVSQSKQHMAGSGQEVIATVKEVPLGPVKKQRPPVDDEATTEAAIAPSEGLEAPPTGPGCGFHGIDKWKKSVCEECVCNQGVTSCQKVQCDDRPPLPTCIPVYHFTQCCPTFQCPNGTSRGQLPSLEVKPLQDGDNCTDVGDFVATSVSNPCLACKCNTKLKIQCKTITCPPPPTDPACKERKPKNPTVCCPEYDCPARGGGKVSSAGHDEDDDEDTEIETTRATTAVTKPATTTVAVQRTTEEETEDVTTEEPMVINIQTVAPATTASSTVKTTATTPTSTAAPEGSSSTWHTRRRRWTTVADVADTAVTQSTKATTTSEALAKPTTTLSTKATAVPEAVTKPTWTWSNKAKTTTAVEAVTDEEGGDDETTVWPPFRPAGAAVVHAPDAEADLPRAQQIRSHISGAAENSVAASSTKTTFSTSSTTTKPTVSTAATSLPVTAAPSTTKSAKVGPAESASAAAKGVMRDCQGGWKFPAGCDINKDCTYIARWRQNPMDQTVQFKVTTRDADKWTGIGFANGKALDNVDMVVGWVDKAQKIIIQDRHGDARNPVADNQQTVFNLRGVRMGSMTTIQFSRRQRTGDDQDVVIDDTNCPYFLFPVRGGAYDTFTMKIQPHVDDPEMSDVGVCLTQCAETAMVGTTPVRFMPSSTPSPMAASNVTVKPAAGMTTAEEEEEADTTPASRKTAAVSGNTGGRCATEGAVVSLNPCQNCTCQKGSIQCINIVCKDSFMQHMGCTPLFKVGVCCPAWQCPTTVVPLSGRTNAPLTTPVSVLTSAPTNQSQDVLAARKQAVAGAVKEDDSENSEQELLIPDKMGVVTPPPGWSERQSERERLRGAVAPDTAHRKQHVDVDAQTLTGVVGVSTDAKVKQDGCLNFACGANATCVTVDASTNAPSCVCKPGFEGNAKIACVKSNQKSGINSCRSVKCGKNAQCFGLNGQPQCKCISGFNGNPQKACDEQITGGFVQPFECQLRGEIGGCQNFGMRWQYDSRISGCRQFVYSGCAGNENNFENRQQCEQRCMAPRRLFKEQQCASDDDVDNSACARCACTEQGHVACTPVSCGAPPNRECKAVAVTGECCPKFDCSFVNATQDAPSITESRSAACPGVMCREPVFRAGCTRSVVPGECCPSVQCNTPAPVEEEEETTAAPVSTTKASTAAPRGLGVPCTADEKISSSNPCLHCQCIKGFTNCTQVMCPPITPEQRRKCRISQLANQCCLIVECPNITASTVASTLATTVTVRTSTPATTTTSTTKAAVASALPQVTAKLNIVNVQPTPAAAAAAKPGCSEASDTGICHAEMTRWYFNAGISTCQTFAYSGCGGNKNRYLTEERCKAACK